MNIIGSAFFSEDKQYRYHLTRHWDKDKPAAVFCMLNPSTADDVRNDPTIKRCQERAMLWGCGSLIVVNAFALRSTDPKALYKHNDPIGPRNSEVIFEAVKNAKYVICGWGKHGKYAKRDRQVLAIIKAAGAIPMALKVNKDGSPSHPLYIGYNVEPKPFEVLTSKPKQDNLEES